jgi:hypothetical protein
MKQKNQIISFVTYAKINSVHGQNNIHVTDLNRGTDYSINGKSLIDELYSADEYDRTEKVGQTKLAETLCHAGHLPFTATFVKKDGSIRTLRGKLNGYENFMGRASVIDFDVAQDKSKNYDTRIRQVDLRTIQGLIVGGVKYELKK